MDSFGKKKKKKKQFPVICEFQSQFQHCFNLYESYSI